MLKQAHRPVKKLGLEAVYRKVLATPARTDMFDTGGERFVAAIGAVAQATLRLRNSNGNVTHGDGSTLFKAGICPAHGDKLRVR